MHRTSSLEEFNLCVTLIVKLLKFQDKELIEACEETLVSLLGSERTADVMTAAVFQLLETEPDSYQWTIHNLSEIKAYQELRQDLIMIAVKKLIEQGFVFGTNFSTTYTNALLVDKETQAALLESLLPTDRILIKEVLLVNN